MALAKAKVQMSDEVVKELGDAVDRATAKQEQKALAGNAVWYEVDETVIEIMLLDDGEDDGI